MWIVRLALRRPYAFVVTALVLPLTPLLLRRTQTDIPPDAPPRQGQERGGFRCRNFTGDSELRIL